MTKMSKGQFSKLFIVISVVLIMLLFTCSQAFAQTVSTAEDLKVYLTSQLNNRQTSVVVSYTGPDTNLQTMVLDILKADDYLKYQMKSYSGSSSVLNNVLTYNFNFSYWTTSAQKAVVDSEVSRVLSEIITTDMNDFQKEKAIHDWIVKTFIYDTSLVQHSDYAGMVSPYKTVCQGYALLTQKMLLQAGISSRIVQGRSSSGVAHVWNLVQLDGKWYHLDTTWDDPIPDNPNKIRYDYYNLTDTQLKANHSWTTTDNYNLPIANTAFSTTLDSLITSDETNATFYNDLKTTLGLQYLYADNTINNAAELAPKIAAAINNNETSLIFRYTRGSANLLSDIRSAATGTLLSSFSYSPTAYLRGTNLTDLIVELTLNYIPITPVHVDSVSLDNSTLTIPVSGTGYSVTLKPTVLPTNSTNKFITWTSGTPSIATVDANGVVKAVSLGTATITAKANDGGATANCTVTVVPAVSSITLNKSTLVLKVGEDDVTFVANVTPANAVADVTWKSSNPAVATVDKNGVVHAVSSGSATISATSTQNTARVGRCAVTVPVPVSDVVIDKASITLPVGLKATLKASVQPLNATIKSIVWTSNKLDIATVSSTGIITPVGIGTAIITATSNDGNITAICDLTVVEAISTVTVDKTSVSIAIGADDVALTATINSKTADSTMVTWISSNPKVATVDENGVVHSVISGTAVISAISTVDYRKYAKCNVIVPVNVTGVSFKSSLATLPLGSKITLIPIIAPTNATYKTVTWTSDKEDIATVSSTGIVTPNAIGTATITATTTDGSKTVSREITVIQGVSGLVLDKATLMIKVGDDDVTLNATVNPTNATVKSLVWVSSNPKVAIVDGNGVVHAVASGTAVITATSTQDTRKMARCNVIVPFLVTGVALKSNSLTLAMGTTSTFVPIITPSNATIKTVKWGSDDESIARVSATGILTPVSLGTAIITVTTTDGNLSATCQVTVIQGVSGIVLDKTSFTIKVGDDDVQLSATVNPTNATIKTLTWVSSNPKVATVDENGIVRAVASGTATITTKSTQDTRKTAKCYVKVPFPVTGITLNASTLTLNIKSTSTLRAVIAPTNATVKTVIWSSSDITKATVSSTGVVTAISSGTATITATTIDGNLTATCYITIN